MDSFDDDERSSEIWGKDAAHPKNVTVNMNMNDHQINIVSDEHD
jgi:hypothetical protein